MAPRKPPVVPTEPPVTPDESLAPSEPVEPAVPSEPVAPSEGEITVKHKTNGKTFKVSQAYYQANKHNLDLLEV